MSKVDQSRSPGRLERMPSGPTSRTLRPKQRPLRFPAQGYSLLDSRLSSSWLLRSCQFVTVLFLSANFALAQTPLAQTPMAQTPMAQTPLAQTPMAQAPSSGSPQGGSSLRVVIGQPVVGDPVSADPIAAEPNAGSPNPARPLELGKAALGPPNEQLGRLVCAEDPDFAKCLQRYSLSQSDQQLRERAKAQLRSGSLARRSPANRNQRARLASLRLGAARVSGDGLLPVEDATSLNPAGSLATNPGSGGLPGELNQPPGFGAPRPRWQRPILPEPMGWEEILRKAAPANAQQLLALHLPTVAASSALQELFELPPVNDQIQAEWFVVASGVSEDGRPDRLLLVQGDNLVPLGESFRRRGITVCFADENVMLAGTFAEVNRAAGRLLRPTMAQDTAAGTPANLAPPSAQAAGGGRKRTNAKRSAPALAAASRNYPASQLVDQFLQEHAGAGAWVGFWGLEAARMTGGLVPAKLSVAKAAAGNPTAAPNVTGKPDLAAAGIYALAVRLVADGEVAALYQAEPGSALPGSTAALPGNTAALPGNTAALPGNTAANSGSFSGSLPARPLDPVLTARSSAVPPVRPLRFEAGLLVQDAAKATALAETPEAVLRPLLYGPAATVPSREEKLAAKRGLKARNAAAAPERKPVALSPALRAFTVTAGVGRLQVQGLALPEQLPDPLVLRLLDAMATSRTLLRRLHRPVAPVISGLESTSTPGPNAKP